jgi:hypothetical protein
MRKKREKMQMSFTHVREHAKEEEDLEVIFL